MNNKGYFPQKVRYLLFMPFMLILLSVGLVLADVSPKTYGLSRGKLWWSAVSGGLMTDRSPSFGVAGDAYPGKFGGSSSFTGVGGTAFSVVGVVDNQPFSWGHIDMNYETAIDVQDQGMRTNYNFEIYGTNVAEEEIWCIGTLTGDSPPIPVKITLKVRSRAWGLPKYDDFIITEITLINADTRPIYNFYAIDGKRTMTPVGSTSKLDDEYIWDSNREVFVFYDAETISEATGQAINYTIAPGDVTGDVGDPGNISTAGSINYQLYASAVCAIGYPRVTPLVDVQTAIMGNGGNIFGEGNLPVSQTETIEAYPGNTGQLQAWSNCGWLNQPNAADPMAPIPQLFKYPNPNMSWREAKNANEPNAGNLYERGTPQMIFGIGPLTLQPGDSLSLTRIVCAGDMDPNISMRGGLEATKMLDLDYASADEGATNEHVSIKNLRTNWDAALELINNNYAVLDNVPPPTCGAPPKVTYNQEYYENTGNPLEVEQFLGEMTGDLVGAESAIQLTWDAVHVNYTDPITGTDDFSGYYIYQSDISFKGPWTKIATVSKGEAQNAVSGDRITMAFPVKAGVPYRYAVTSFDTDGNESALTCYNYEAYTTKRSASNDFSQVRIMPNPFKQRSGFLDTGEYKRLTFVNIPSKCTIKIYNLAGELMKSLNHDDGTGEEAWGSNLGTGDYMLTEYFSNVMPGLYIYHVESHVSGHEGETAVGKFVIIK